MRGRFLRTHHSCTLRSNTGAPPCFTAAHTRLPGWGRRIAGACLWSVTLWLLVSTTTHAQQPEVTHLPANRADCNTAEAQQRLASLPSASPTLILAHAQAWRQEGCPFPDSLLQPTVEMALQPDATWEHAQIAMRFFDVYHDRPWAQPALEAFATSHAIDILMNADALAALNQAWTLRAVEIAAAKAPEWALKALHHIAQVDQGWARQFAETMVLTSPALLLAHADILLTVDRHWARGVISQAAQRAPRQAVQEADKYLAEPWGEQLFIAMALSDPYGTVASALPGRPESQVVRHALMTSTDMHLQALAQIVNSAYETEVKWRMGVFVPDMVAGRLTLDAAARLSTHAQSYFRSLVAMRFQESRAQPRAVDFALSEAATILVGILNELHDQPDAVRFRSVEAFNAQELYMLLTYGEAQIYTSSYRGVFTRLLAMMQQERVTGEQLLAQLHYLQFRSFVKAAAFFNRLEAFLATMSSPAARNTLLTRCLRDIDREPEMTVQAMIAAEILDTPFDPVRLDLVRHTLLSEYQRVEQEGKRQATLMYGLLIARLAQKGEYRAPDLALATVAQRYRPYLPDLSAIPLAKLFPGHVSVQRHFFYKDDDGEQSFQSFLAQYRQTKTWHIEDYPAFVTMTATHAGRRMLLYANKPTVSESIDEVDRVLAERGLTPGVVVHRGHSYHVGETIRRIPATAAYVFLGSCGSYRQLDDVLSRAPEAHILTTKGIASHTINDPLLKELNEHVLYGKGARWADFWRQATATLAANPRFADYVPPDKNTSAMYLMAYRALTTERLLSLPLRQVEHTTTSRLMTAP
jgi:hypothetical protein